MARLRRLSLETHDVNNHQSSVIGGALDDPGETATREEWWAHQDSNLGQAGYEPAALTAELWALSSTD